MSAVRFHRCCAALLALAGTVAGAQSPIAGSVVFGTGYDGEAVILPETLMEDAGADGASADARAQLGWRALRTSGGRVDVAVNGGYRQVDGDAFDEVRAGGGISGTGAIGPVAINAVADGDRRWLDGAGLAWNAGLTLGAAVAIDRQVARPEVEVRVWDFDNRSAADGIEVQARYRHWLPIADGDPRRRAELGVSTGRYQADADRETYGEARVDAAVQGRIGPRRGSGRWDFSAGTWYALRDYADGAREQRHLVGAAGSLDRWFDPWVALGLEAGWDLVAERPDGDDHDGARAALRATAAF